MTFYSPKVRKPFQHGPLFPRLNREMIDRSVF